LTDVSVVVPFHNTERHIGRCLRALERQLPFGGSYEIVMVDNGSTDGSAQFVRASGRARLLSERRPGAYAARNTGVAASSGSVIAFTDSDCAPEPEWLRRITEQMSDRRIAVVLGARSPAGRSHALGLVARYERAKNDFIFGSGIPDLYYGWTNNMAVRRDVFERLGPFAERLRGSDALFVRRVVDALSPESVRYTNEICVEHLEIRRLVDYYRKVFVYGRSFRRFGPLGHVRPLRTRERLHVWRRTARSGSPADAAALFALLAAGAVFWWAGSVSGLAFEAT
jgi:glycosyltransferase involved in cell wall biosynthesis